MESYFNDIASKINERLLSANTTIRIAVSWFTNKELYDSLLLKAKGNVQVELVIVNDNFNFNPFGLDFQPFIERGGKLYVCRPDTFMNNKYCIIDNIEVLSGSYDWTYTAESNSFTDIMSCRDISVVEQYNDHFEKLKKLGEFVTNVQLIQCFPGKYLHDDVVCLEREWSPAQYFKAVPQALNPLPKFRPEISRKFKNRQVSALSVSPNGKYLAATGCKWVIQIWEIDSGELIFKHDLKCGNSYSYPSYIIFSPDSSTLIMDNGTTGIIAISIIERQVLYNNPIRGYKMYIGGLSFNSTGDKIAFSCRNKVYILESRTGSLIQTIKTAFDDIYTLVFINHDRDILVGTIDNNIKYKLKRYSVDTANHIFNYSSSHLGFYTIKIIDDHSFLTCGYSSELSIFDLAKASPVMIFKGHTSTISDCDVDLGKNLVVSCSSDASVKLWDVRSGVLLKSFNEHTGSVTKVCFDTKHSVIFSASMGGEILTHPY